MVPNQVYPINFSCLIFLSIVLLLHSVSTAILFIKKKKKREWQRKKQKKKRKKKEKKKRKKNQVTCWNILSIHVSLISEILLFNLSLLFPTLVYYSQIVSVDPYFSQPYSRTIFYRLEFECLQVVPLICLSFLKNFEEKKKKVVKGKSGENIRG